MDEIDSCPMESGFLQGERGRSSSAKCGCRPCFVSVLRRWASDLQRCGRLKGAEDGGSTIASHPPVVVKKGRGRGWPQMKLLDRRVARKGGLENMDSDAPPHCSDSGFSLEHKSRVRTEVAVTSVGRAVKQFVSSAGSDVVGRLQVYDIELILSKAGAYPSMSQSEDQVDARTCHMICKRVRCASLMFAFAHRKSFFPLHPTHIQPPVQLPLSPIRVHVRTRLYVMSALVHSKHASNNTKQTHNSGNAAAGGSGGEEPNKGNDKKGRGHYVHKDELKRKWRGLCIICGQNRHGHWTQCRNPCAHCKDAGKPGVHHNGKSCPVAGPRFFKDVGGGAVGDTNRNKVIIEDLQDQVAILREQLKRSTNETEFVKVDRDRLRADLEHALLQQRNRTTELAENATFWYRSAEMLRQENETLRRNTLLPAASRDVGGFYSQGYANGPFRAMGAPPAPPPHELRSTQVPPPYDVWSSRSPPPYRPRHPTPPRLRVPPPSSIPRSPGDSRRRGPRRDRSLSPRSRVMRAEPRYGYGSHNSSRRYGPDVYGQPHTRDDSLGPSLPRRRQVRLGGYPVAPTRRSPSPVEQDSDTDIDMSEPDGGVAVPRNEETTQPNHSGRFRRDDKDRDPNNYSDDYPNEIPVEHGDDPVPSTMKTTATTPMTSTTIIATIPPALSEMELQIETLSQAGNIRERSRLLANTLTASTLTYENFSLIYRTTSVCYGLLRGRVYMTIVIDSRLRDQRPIE
ncbi:hypothetical protein B0J12DRAFT_764846 [Macrophomina phaseolina]|uniref:Uncharacterized protein n=1 Tax=Macrophomina phaseolina TaxID=35725 RepID=A0ABQ8FZ91_9PEZI|nr:hypothetical protein B0J12DRAFT_764846 [Macrophomina phaseolina]